MNAAPRETDNPGYAIPPEIYDIAVGWDPQPEVNRLLFLTRQAGVEPRSALELGCGTGRLLSVLGGEVPDVCGIELSPVMTEWGRRRSGCEILVGDMADFALSRRFDLIFTSANTIRHILTDEAIARLWGGIGAHLLPDGVFVADLELGFAAEAAKVGKATSWTVSRGATEVHASWLVAGAPSPKTRCCRIEYAFEARGEEVSGRWRECFELRTYDAPEFLELAWTGGSLEAVGIHELRDPYLIETPAEKAVGRFLVVLRRAKKGTFYFFGATRCVRRSPEIKK